MNGLKLKLLGELLDHLSQSQGGDLKSLMDEEAKPPEEEVSPLEEGKPKGIEVAKVSVLGKPKSFDDQAGEAMDQAVPPKEDEPTDEELEELLRKLTG